MRKNQERLMSIEIPADGKNGIAGGAYCHFFMYTKHHGNFILKGYWREVYEYIKKQNYGPWFANRHVFRGKSGDPDWTNWIFYKEEIGIFEPSKLYRHRNKNRWTRWQNKYKIRPYHHARMGDTDITEINLKRMPHKWIPEFDQFTKEIYE